MAIKNYFVAYTYAKPVPLHKPEKRVFNNASHMSEYPMNGKLVREILKDLSTAYKGIKISIINIIPLEES